MDYALVMDLLEYFCFAVKVGRGLPELILRGTCAVHALAVADSFIYLVRERCSSSFVQELKSKVEFKFPYKHTHTYLTRDGTAEPPNPSRETKFSGAKGDWKIFHFPVQLITSRIGNLTRFIHALLCDKMIELID